MTRAAGLEPMLARVTGDRMRALFSPEFQRVGMSRPPHRCRYHVSGDSVRRIATARGFSALEHEARRFGELYTRSFGHRLDVDLVGVEIEQSPDPR